jgi:response regulator RpfG family c-di-GMP phosphodiesterase
MSMAIAYSRRGTLAFPSTLLLHNRVNLMICETRVPDIPGFDFLARLRDVATLGAMPRIFTRILPEPPHLTWHYHGFLAKPFHMDDLLRLVASVLDDRANQWTTC